MFVFVLEKASQMAIPKWIKRWSEQQFKEVKSSWRKLRL